MTLEKVSIKEFKKLIYPEYKKIFPAIERRSYRQIKKSYNNSTTELIKIIVENKFIGFCIMKCLKGNPYVILDYFAILPEYQCRGYGSNSIKLLKEMYKEYDGIFIEIEKPENDQNSKENEIRKRRIKFYKNLDFCKMGFELELFTITYLPYMLSCSNEEFSDENVIKDIFEIYNAVSGERIIKKNCKVIRQTEK